MTPQDKIKEAKHCLAMIEVEDINHDELNVRVWCLRQDLVFNVKNLSSMSEIIPLYSCSLDYAQSLMLEGWDYKLETFGEHFVCSLQSRSPKWSTLLDSVTSPRSETQALAWLHAIIQSWIWTWENE